jgi:DNA processing protein
MSEEVLALLALSSVEGLGCRTIHRLLDHFKDPCLIFASTRDNLVRQGVPEPLAASLLSGKPRDAAGQTWSRCQQDGIQIVPFRDSRYPGLLKEIYDPPVVLYIKGEIATLQRPVIALVGSRHPTPYGLNAAERLARDLAGRGLVIASGMARGIDSASHRGALSARGTTVAVLGSGLDLIYPRENQKLARQIEQSGCLISEFPPGTPPVPQNFPVRNRIISGISLGTCVVEAAEFSGSLITARLALEQGREVFAVPGNITSKNSFGPNLWIKQGAKLVQDWKDIVEELPRPVKEGICQQELEAAGQRQGNLFGDAFTTLEKRVLELLTNDEALHVDQLLESSGLSSSELLATLSELEMKDKVRQLRGKYFVRKF